LFLSDGYFASVIADAKENKVLQLKTYTCEDKKIDLLELDYSTIKGFTELITDISFAYKNKKIIISNCENILAPETLLNVADLESYYKNSRPFRDSCQLQYSKLHIFHTASVFSTRNEIVKFARFSLGAVEIIHSSLLFVKAVDSLAYEELNKKLFINVHRNFIEILALGQKEIKFYNSFKFDTETDLVYFVLAVAEQLDMANDFSIHLFGNANTDDSAVNLLRRYIKNVKFGKSNSRFLYPVSFNYFNPHNFFIESNSLLCE